ncbi:phytanoyl-CoA dioxygenase family protein [Actinokineospora diospyrosa]|uniref:Ectoine hydroxylase-related dioxygenase, phytanoyl-CoA dioxygenase (PhyH) family n=1 Tax=Actinokineospora diospyrosa TaxID=103728 RepID=A0ABT1IFF6_9PSEU|nr:phytanoyl-CoA dioxygenase family protein [Actinokineospora diospyrosa]MCP2271355.1 Ectoine hydroxylase-related dioxygenase, phytanoyl-CoA dioxygenase (PhyH) family [Actinokineospora diospyrosa]
MTAELTDQYALTEAERALLPTDDEVAEYAARGWYLSRKLFSDAEMDTLVEATERFYAGHTDRRLPLRPPNLAYWTPEKGDVQRHNDYIHYESDEVAAILRKPLLGAVAARLARAEEIRVWQSTLIFKPPRPQEQSNQVPWHMDRHYWQTCTSERMLTAFIPFHDCDERMGTITMVDGSNTWTEIPGDDSTRHFAHRDKAELEQLLAANAAHNGAEVRKIPMIIPKGHVSFHHCRTYHGSGANLADHPRRAISLHLQDGDNRFRPYLKPDGTPVFYNHDVLVRRNDEGMPDYTDPTYCPTLWRK